MARKDSTTTTHFPVGSFVDGCALAESFSREKLSSSIETEIASVHSSVRRPCCCRPLVVCRCLRNPNQVSSPWERKKSTFRWSSSVTSMPVSRWSGFGFWEDLRKTGSSVSRQDFCFLGSSVVYCVWLGCVGRPRAGICYAVLYSSSTFDVEGMRSRRLDCSERANLALGSWRGVPHRDVPERETCPTSWDRILSPFSFSTPSHPLATLDLNYRKVDHHGSLDLQVRWYRQAYH